MKKSLKQILGFSVMELLVAVAIVAVLAAIALPSYLDYKRKSHFSGVEKAALNLKSTVAQCVQKLGTVNGCSGGANGIPANVNAGNGKGDVSSITIADGVITITPKTVNGMDATDTFVLTPTFTPNKITWSVSGGACIAGYATDCNA